MIEQMYDYYEFADRMKFDLVIGFDLGGKYTFKDGECSDIQLKLGLSSIDFDSLNFILLEKTVEYLKRHPNYFPKVYATIHGTTPDKYENYIKRVLDLEKNYNFEFFGYALGGVASSKNIDSSWLANSPNKSLKNPTVVREAMKIVKKYAIKNYHIYEDKEILKIENDKKIIELAYTAIKDIKFNILTEVIEWIYFHQENGQL